MEITLDDARLLLKDKRVVPIIAFFIFDIVLLIGVISLGMHLYSQYQTYNAERAYISELQAKVETIKRNQVLLNKNVESYTDIATSLIPDDESYFKLINSLEKLSQKNGMEIISYSINLAETTEEKLTLTVSVRATDEQISQFLDNHLYVSGRLITHDQIELNFDSDEEDLTILSLNFYHKDFNRDVGGETDDPLVDSAQAFQSEDIQIPEITQEEIELLEEAKAKAL